VATWNNDNSTGLWNDADNWDTNSVPGSGDDVVFDATSTDNCTLDVDAQTIASLDVQSGYSGTLDFANSGYDFAITGDATFDGTGEVDCGDATITVSGNLDNSDQTSWTTSNSHVVMDGAGKYILSNVQHEVQIR